MLPSIVELFLSTSCQILDNFRITGHLFYLHSVMSLTVGSHDSEVMSSLGYTMWHCTIPLHLTSRSGFATGPRAQQLYRLENL